MKDSKIIVAIDGYAACGKSTLAKALAKLLGYIYIDSGAMYRAVTLHCLDNSINWNDENAIFEALKEIHISFQNHDGKNYTYLNGVNVEDKIREMRVSEAVSPVSTVSAVRRAMVQQQMSMGADKGIVMDGRDIGTVVFPSAELKLFMTASPKVRTQRRLDELKRKGTTNVSAEDVMQNLLDRDRIDSSRADSPLRQAEDAIVIDNSDYTQEQQLQIALQLANELIEVKMKSSEVTID